MLAAIPASAESSDRRVEMLHRREDLATDRSPARGGQQDRTRITDGLIPPITLNAGHSNEARSASLLYQRNNE